MISMEKYFVTYKMAISKEMQYKVNFLLSIISSAVPMVMSVFLWNAIYRNQSTTYGYTYNQMIMYTILAALISSLVSAGFASDISADIKSGNLNKFLILPIGYLFYRLFNFLGEKVVHLFMCSALIIITLKVYNVYTGFRIGSSHIGLFCLATLLGVFLNFLIFLVVGITAFWFVETSYLFWAVKEIVLLASGGIFPLEVYGKIVNNILRYLPFKYTTYFPINIINGKMTDTVALQGLVIQVVWIIILIGLIQALWRKGIKDYVAVGG